MTRARPVLVGVVFAALVSMIGVAAPASGATTNLLGGHGNFEKPALTGQAQNFAPGQNFDGWQVSKATVAVIAGLPGLEVPPQGLQALVLDDPQGQGGSPAGAVCRTIPTIAGHRYAVSFYGGVATGGSARIVAELGAISASVGPIAGVLPVAFTKHKVTLRAAAANALFCLTASKVKPLAFPIVDGAKVVDLGA